MPVPLVACLHSLRLTVRQFCRPRWFDVHGESCYRDSDTEGSGVLRSLRSPCQVMPYASSCLIMCRLVHVRAVEGQRMVFDVLLVRRSQG
jgi:hypothetical protein